ncbi:MAG TPA: S-layer homology domain-containing protein [Chloroflexia bacterium]|nr:S-layer homology domain-containing protein [Chloroflexia bacterium]
MVAVRARRPAVVVALLVATVLLALGLMSGAAWAGAPTELQKTTGKSGKAAAPLAPDVASFVYHEQSNALVGEGCSHYVADPDRSADAGWQTYSAAYGLRYKSEFQANTNQWRVYYTTDGSNPGGALGAPSGTTQVVTGASVCTFSDETQSGQTVEVISASIPAKSPGTTVKYILSAWHSGGGAEVFANSGACSGCVSCTQASCATLFQYAVIAGGPTATPTSPSGPNPTATPPGGPCDINGRFTDVPAGSPFYEFVECLYCRGAINGYEDNTFRPNVLTTRGQIAKIVALAFAFGESDPANHKFADVPRGSTFYRYIEAIASREIISGYPCSPGSALEPCDDQGRPYFRPGNNVTRGQLSKIVVIAGQQALGWTLVSRSEEDRSFSDVYPGSTYYEYIETAFCHNMIGGYPCGGPGETCDSQNRAYFREGTNATRGQISKIVCTAVRNDATCVVARPEKK